MGTEVTPIPSGAEGLKELVALAGQARGIDIVTVTGPVDAVGVPSVIPVAVRHGTTPELVDVSRFFESYRDHPKDKRGTAKALTLASFIALVNRHKTEHSAVFADTDWHKPSFDAVIDYHEIDADGQDTAGTASSAPAPGNLKHHIRYEFPLSEEWQAWVKLNGEPLSQVAFAAFIEDHIAELASPTDAEALALERDFQTTVATPSALMTLSRGLQVNVDSVVKQAHTLQTGEGQIQWEETHKDGEGKPLKVPGIFILSVSPFFMGENIRIPVRLRYRAGGGKLTWYLNMYRPDEHITDRVQQDLIKVAGETALPTFEGSPEA